MNKILNKPFNISSHLYKCNLFNLIKTSFLLGCVKILYFIFLIFIQLEIRADSNIEFSPSKAITYYNLPHFKIIYNKESGELIAKQVATIAEEIRNKVSNLLTVPAPQLCNILIIDNYDYANGSAIGYPYNTIRVFTNSPKPPILGSSDISDSVGNSWLYDLLVHEYTHIVHLNYFSGWTKIWKYGLNNNPFHLFYPNWFIEGLAVFVETELSNRGRGHTKTSEMFLRTDALNNNFQPVGTWGNKSLWPRAGARYLYGGSFLTYVGEKFGNDVFKKILDGVNWQIPIIDDFSLNWFGRLLSDLGWKKNPLKDKTIGGLERGFEVATTYSLSNVVSDWEKLIFEKSHQTLINIKKEGIIQGVKLTNTSANTRCQSVSEDNNFLAYISGSDQDIANITIIDLKTNKTKTIIKHDDFFGCISWSYDGKSIFYSRLSSKKKFFSSNTIFSDLYEYSLESKKEKRLTHSKRLFDPVQVHTSKNIIAIQQEDGVTSVVEFNLQNKLLTTLYKPEIEYQLSSPSISLNEKTIAMSILIQANTTKKTSTNLETKENTENVAKYGIALLDIDTKEIKIIQKPSNNIIREPVWLTDNLLLVSSDLNDIYNIYILDTEDENLYKLTNVITGAFKPEIKNKYSNNIDANLDKKLPIYYRGYNENGFDIYKLESSLPAELIAKLSSAEKNNISKINADSTNQNSSEINASNIISTNSITNNEETKLIPQRYYPILNMKLGPIAPFIGNDEGSISENFNGGKSLGISASFFDPSFIHSLYLEAGLGIKSKVPSYLVSYSNLSLGFPMRFYSYSNIYQSDIINVNSKDYKVWNRYKNHGLEVSVPIMENNYSFYFLAGGYLGDFNTFFALNKKGIEGNRYGAYQAFQYYSGKNSPIRQPAKSDSFLLYAGESGFSYNLDGESKKGNFFELEYYYTHQFPIGRGAMQIDNQSGIKKGDDFYYLIGGYNGSWALPGIDPDNLIKGKYATILLSSIEQDIWRPEFAIGKTPTIYLSNVNAFLTLGGTLAFENNNYNSGFAFSGGLQAVLFAFRNDVTLIPGVGFGFDMRTNTFSYWLNINILEQLRSKLMPFSLKKERLKPISIRN